MTPRQQIQAKNHPQTGSMIAVDPIRSLEDVALVRSSLADRNGGHSRNLTLFTLGVNTNLRAGDLLSLRVSNIDFAQQRLVLREQKTGKTRHIDISPEVWAMLSEYHGQPRANLLFTSRKGGGKIGVTSLNHMVKKWCADVGLKGHYGSHTLRKTWAFIQYRIFGTDLAVVSRELNHSSMDVTYRYLGITPDEVKAAYMRFI